MFVTIFTGKNGELVRKEMRRLKNTFLYEDSNHVCHPSAMPDLIKGQINYAIEQCDEVAFFTYSQEIIEAIYYAATPHVKLVRFTERDAKVYKTEFDSEEIKIALANDIDMR